MLLWSTRRAQPLAELSQAERSEAQPREARPPPKAAGAVRRPGAEGDPRASRGLQTKARMRLYWLRLSSWRLNSSGRRESVLCTNGIQWFERHSRPAVFARQKPHFERHRLLRHDEQSVFLNAVSFRSINVVHLAQANA